MIWHPEHDVDGSLRYVLRIEPKSLALAVLTRYYGPYWSLIHAQGVQVLKGSLRHVKGVSKELLGV